MKTNQILLVLAVVAVAGGAYYVYNRQRAGNNNMVPLTGPAPRINPNQRNETADTIAAVSSGIGALGNTLTSLRDAWD